MPNHKPDRCFLKKIFTDIQLPGGVWLIALWGLLMGIATTMIYSQLGMFLKHELNATPLKIAMLDGFVEFLSNLTRIFAGVLSDFMRNRKLILVAGCALSILIKPLFVMAHSIYTVLIAQSLDRFSNGIQASPRDALIADISNDKQISSAYGLSRSLKTIGAFIGAFTAVGLLRYHGGQYRTIFMYAFIPAIIAVVLLLKVKEKTPQEDQKLNLRLKNPFSKQAIKSLNWGYWKIIVFAFIFEMAHFSDALLAVRANDFVEPVMASMASIAMTVGQLVCAYPIGVLADKFGKHTFVLICVIMMLLSNILLLSAWSLVPVFIGAFFWGAQMSSVVGLFLSLVTESVDEHLRGTAIGIYYAVIGVGYVFASAIAGDLWSSYGNKYAFIYSISVCVVSLILFQFTFKRNRSRAS